MSSARQPVCAGQHDYGPVSPEWYPAGPYCDDARLWASMVSYDHHAERYSAWASDLSMEPALDKFGSMLAVAASSQPAPRVLDAGCGSGRDLAAMTAKGFDPIGVDMSVGLLDHAHGTGCPVVRADLRSLPFGERCFDGVWACASLVHFGVDGTRSALRQFTRVLRPKGVLFATVKLGDDTESWCETSIAGWRWFRYWRPATFSDLVSELGFRVSEVVVDRGAWINVFATAGA